MATTFTNLVTSITQKITVSASKLADGVVRDAVDTELYSKTLKFGTGDDQNDIAYILKAKTIGASGLLSLDLSGPLTDFFGDPIAFSKIKSLYLENISTNDATRIAVGSITNPVMIFSGSGDSLPIPKDGVFFISSRLTAGWTNVTPGTGDLLIISNLDAVNAATINLVVTGVSA